MKTLICCLLTLFLVHPLAAQNPETPAQRDARMQWFREAKFGMFIHWGLYAVSDGTYQGKRIGGLGEWMMYTAKIPVADYRAYAKEFNPQGYDPESWVLLAKATGMKYIVITAKHHDGFALFPSEVTDWDIADATPYGQDLIGPLAEVTRKHGLKFGTYYSQAQDWVHPGGSRIGAETGKGWDPAQNGSFDHYLQKIAIPQTRELLTRYQPDILWWDTPLWMNPKRAQPLNDCLALCPGIITNDRLGGDFKGDTTTPEQHIPATGFKDRDWETCMTMNSTWGFKSYDHSWKSTELLVRNLIDIVSKGGNYLLNVGPDPSGKIPEASVERLKEIGQWMQTNGTAIYGTTASPFSKLRWGRCTVKATPQGGKLYLHVFHWPEDGRLSLPGLRNKILSGRLLATNASTPIQSEAGESFVLLPKQAPDPIASVIELEFSGPLEVERRLLRPEADGSIHLSAEMADLHNSLDSQITVEGIGAQARITGWKKPQSTASWDFETTTPGNYLVSAEIAGPGHGKFALAVANNRLNTEVPPTKEPGKRSLILGSIVLPAAGSTTLELKPESKNWKGFELLLIKLTPQKP